ERDATHDRCRRYRPSCAPSPGAHCPTPSPPACHCRLRPRHGAPRPGASRLPLVCRLAWRWCGLCSPPPRRLRGTTCTLRLRGCTPKVCGHRAGDGTERHENLGPLALAVPDMLAPNLRGMGCGIHAALLLGTCLLSATA